MISHTGGWWRGADDLNGSNAGIVYCLSLRCELDALTDAATVTHCRGDWHSANSIAILPHIKYEYIVADLHAAGLTPVVQMAA